MVTRRKAWLKDYVGKRAKELAPTFEAEREGAVSLLADPEWIWNALLNSMATYGNSRGYERLHDSGRGYWHELRYAKLAEFSEEQRREVIERAYRDINPRYLSQKVETLLRAHRRIAELGGPESAKRVALSQPSADAKIRFMRGFHGIGAKYARNIWMDVHDPDVRNYAAVDGRLTEVAQLVDSSFAGFDQIEAFYRSVSAELGLELWSLDRVVYRDYDRIRQHLEA